ncbi:YesL family protein [Aquibacillus rhizosphaerae]|uniref:DUF624 domain-containing protein n=1 Tax=Aquibacillus rhizosphaerae TaxID=3051431 RepID=A0ABT7L378_9BACI|nr:DUF624 domain-containing protein [Aquibacillus sp. LR5S19]MDL4840316.1 DUF624 domain-containing protein [Aquibacillus sp. LR5S19]
MNKSENVFFRVLDIFAHFVLLNTVWVIACIPIVTVFPATAALFAVVRKWTTEGIEAGVFPLFFKYFRENFKKSFVIGILWKLAGIILVLDFSIVFNMAFTGRMAVLAMLLFTLIIYLFTSIYVFFILVNYDFNVIKTLRNALLLSVSNISYTLLCTFIITGMIVITYFLPIFFIIFGSVLAFTLYYIFQKITTRMYQSQDKSQLAKN